ncbi:hypothetical protein [Vibrio splendidus]|uniref:hypothetical protein n=1 Tax=Vibrio splendidus TaxID=29497 RepID=UPI0011B71E98|nr:hypothetical protein [Vibrio splendidus]
MTIHKAVALGVAGNELSKQITGTDEVCPERTVVATGSGAALGAAASGALVVTGVAAAPIAVPLAVGAAMCAGIASLFD